jgi:FkbM family methyltransferase
MPKWKRQIWKSYLRFIGRFDNHSFARLASFGATVISGARQRVKFDAETGSYTVDGMFCHRFAHKSRVDLFLYGLQDRGHVLGDGYLLGRVQFEDGDIVVDCGANIGDLGLYFATIGMRVRVFAFEPSPVEYDLLVRNVAANPFTDVLGTYNVALWEESSDGVDFFVKSESADSSILPIANYDQKITVPSRRLDEILPRRKYRLLKLEAEGAEPEILRGAGQILDCFDFISVDAGFERGMTQETTAPEVIRYLFAHGFELVDLNPKRVTFLFQRSETIERI